MPAPLAATRRYESGCLDIDAALASIRRHPHFWRAVGLDVGALMREKTLDGFEVEKLVRSAKDGE